MVYTVKKLADLAGVSIRTLHYYDEIGILKPQSLSATGYRLYGEESVQRLQHILFFRELDFSLGEIKKITSLPGFDALDALQSHRTLLEKKADRIRELITTIDKTIQQMKGKAQMEIKEYYQGFSDEKIEKYREEVRRRWGAKTLEESERRVKRMGKEKFAALQSEGRHIFRTISDNMPSGYDSDIIQAEVARWRKWLENFHQYSDDALLGLGRVYSRDPKFAAFFRKIHPDLPEFLTRAIEYYCRQNL